MKMKSTLLWVLLILASLEISAQTYSRLAGHKSYELSNHLGHVTTVVNDRKCTTSQPGGTTVAKTDPDIVASNDYYPYGMPMEERNMLDGYRYGFQSQELDDEVKGKGNSYDFGERSFYARTGRWLSRDNHAKAFQSDYAFGKGNPIIFIDPDGNDDYYYNQQGQHVATIKTGQEPRFFTIQTEYFITDAGDVDVAVYGQPTLLKTDTWSQDGLTQFLAYRHLGDIERVEAIADDYRRAGNTEMALALQKKHFSILGHKSSKETKALVFATLAIPVVVIAAAAAGPAVISELSLIAESAPQIYGATKTMVATNAIGGTANAVYEISSAAISTGDINNTNLTSVVTGYTNGPFWSAAFSSYAPFNLNEGFSPVNSFSDFKSKTLDFTTSLGVGGATNSFMGPLSNEIGNSDLFTPESGRTMFNYFQFSVESASNAMSDGIKTVLEEEK